MNPFYPYPPSFPSLPPPQAFLLPSSFFFRIEDLQICLISACTCGVCTFWEKLPHLFMVCINHHHETSPHMRRVFTTHTHTHAHIHTHARTPTRTHILMLPWQLFKLKPHAGEVHVTLLLLCINIMKASIASALT